MHVPRHHRVQPVPSDPASDVAPHHARDWSHPRTAYYVTNAYDDAVYAVYASDPEEAIERVVAHRYPERDLALDEDERIMAIGSLCASTELPSGSAAPIPIPDDA